MDHRINNLSVSSFTFNKRVAAGFTLIELMAVIVIIAILFTFATLAIRNASPEDVIQREARRFEQLVRLALEESILRGEEYAIEVFVDGYRFYRFENGWLPLSDDTILKDRQLPEDMELEMSLEETEIIIDPGAALSRRTKGSGDDAAALLGDALTAGEAEEEPDDKEAEVTPQIFLLSSGEISPEFNIRFFMFGIEASYHVSGRFDGELKTEQSEL